MNLENKQTFVHISKYANAEIQEKLLNIPSFLAFQKQRDESADDIEQTIEVLRFVGEFGKL